MPSISAFSIVRQAANRVTVAFSVQTGLGRGRESVDSTRLAKRVPCRPLAAVPTVACPTLIHPEGTVQAAFPVLGSQIRSMLFAAWAERVTVSEFPVPPGLVRTLSAIVGSVTFYCPGLPVTEKIWPPGQITPSIKDLTTMIGAAPTAPWLLPPSVS